MFEGRSIVLVHEGQIDKKALARESLTKEELVEVIHRQGFERMSQVKRCELEPNGTFYVEAYEPSTAETQHDQLVEKLDSTELAKLPRCAGNQHHLQFGRPLGRPNRRQGEIP